MEDLTADWHQEIKQVVKEYADQKTKLWSFEVKLLLNRSNLRECFFQAVSNSSWSNLGYIAAAEVEGLDTMKELRMLFAFEEPGRKSNSCPSEREARRGLGNLQSPNTGEQGFFSVYKARPSISSNWRPASQGMGLAA
jgi:hypothetical protein